MISSENIILRALEPDDVDLLYKWENDAETWRVSNTRMPVSKFMLASYIKSCDKDFWESKEMRLIIESSEALQLIMEYASNELGIYQLYANVAESNSPSIELFKKLEFETVGLKKKWLKIPSGWEGEYLFQKRLGCAF